MGRRQASYIWKEDVMGGGLPKTQCAQDPIFQVTILDRKCFGAYNSSHDPGKAMDGGIFPSLLSFSFLFFFFPSYFSQSNEKEEKKIKGKREKYLLIGKEIKRKV